MRKKIKKTSFFQRARSHHLYQKVGAGVLVVAFSTFVHTFSANLRTDILQTPTPAAFNGTVSPLEKVPAWTALTTDEWNATYDAIPSDKFIAFPAYDVTALQTPISSLQWGDPEDDAIRDAKITFPVVYLGTYEGDFQENAGSHPAVDIKAPEGTPIRAIANGAVEKVSYSSGGFGNSVVIRHDDAPDPDNPNNRIVLYSSYSHMNTIFVSEGQVVQKGENIGTVGHTGTATTNHVHFQIDRDSASWHPYWPFTSADQKAAGLSFFDAINAGLGIDNARTHTINPLSYVQTFKDETNSATTSVTETEVVTENPEVESVTVVETTVSDVEIETDTNIVVPEEIIIDSVTPSVVVDENIRFAFLHDGSFVPGAPETVTIAVKKGSDFITDFQPQSGVKLTIGRGAGTITPDRLTKDDFVGGQSTFVLIGEDDGSIQLKATMGSTSGVTVLENGVFPDVIEGDSYYEAVKTLKKDGIIQGYPDGTFKPTQSVSRVEALKFIFAGAEVAVDTATAPSLKFPDTDPKGWYAPYVQTAQMLKIIKGYPDGTFKPVNTVNRVEFLKMLFASANIDVSKLVVQKNPFPDVDKDAWYAPYVVYAKQKGLIDADVSSFEPNGVMTRGEVAEVLYMFRKKLK